MRIGRKRMPNAPEPIQFLLFLPPFCERPFRVQAVTQAFEHAHVAMRRLESRHSRIDGRTTVRDHRSPALKLVTLPGNPIPVPDAQARIGHRRRTACERRVQRGTCLFERALGALECRLGVSQGPFVRSSVW